MEGPEESEEIDEAEESEELEEEPEEEPEEKRNSGHPDPRRPPKNQRWNGKGMYVHDIDNSL